MSPFRPYDIITFDCYGTLVDWEGGIGGAFEEAAQKAGVSLDRRRVLEQYALIEPHIQAESYQPYASVLCKSAKATAESVGWQIDESMAGFLPASLPRWPPFDDTNAALERLTAAGYSLGILSNIDDPLLAETRKHFSVDFELVVTAAQVRSYKPALDHFITARDRIGDRRWLHAAQSYFHDVVPAATLGIPVAWINRKGELPSGGAQPNMEFRNLAEFADRLT